MRTDEERRQRVAQRRIKVWRVKTAFPTATLEISTNFAKTRAIVRIVEEDSEASTWVELDSDSYSALRDVLYDIDITPEEEEEG